MKNLSERLIWARTRKGLSQDQLASSAGVSQSTIGNLEAGIRLTARKITSIASALGVNAMWLAEGIGKAIPPDGAPSVREAPALELVEPVAMPKQEVDTKQLARLLDLYFQSTDHGRMQIVEYAEGTEKSEVVLGGAARND